MKTYKRIIGFVILLLMISCALESKFGLPNDEKIKPELLGEWFNDKNVDEKIIINKNSDKTYKILIIDTENTDELISYSKTIRGFTIMNIKSEYNGKITNVFYGINVNENKLTFSEVNDNLHEEEFESESDLFRFFEANVNKQDFFVNPTELKRN